MGQGMLSTLQSLAGLSVPADTLGKIQHDYVEQAKALWNTVLEKPDALKIEDRRFAAPDWKSNPCSAYLQVGAAGVALPVGGRETTVFDLQCIGLFQDRVPQGLGLLDVVVLNLAQCVGRHRQAGQ